MAGWWWASHRWNGKGYVKKNSGKRLLACTAGRTSSKSTTQGPNCPFCSVLLSAFCHSLPFSFPDFVFVLKIRSTAITAHLPADLCHEFLHSPTSQPLTRTVKSIWHGMSNSDMRVRVDRYNGVVTDSKLKSRDHLFPAEVWHLSFMWKSVPGREREVWRVLEWHQEWMWQMGSNKGFMLQKKKLCS